MTLLEKLKQANEARRLQREKTRRAWRAMIDRCTNKKNQAYNRYGGRGIAVCKRWMSFENFLSDMGHSPESKSLDRIDNMKDYSPKNCRWANHYEQNRNRRNIRFVIYKGKKMLLLEAAKKVDIPYTNISGVILRYLKTHDGLRALGIDPMATPFTQEVP